MDQSHRFVNVQHSPIGSFASFTLGHKGPAGGLGVQQGKPADEPIYIGLESRDDPNRFEALPFYDGKARSEADRYVSDTDESPEMDDPMLGDIPGVQTYMFDDDQISRDLTLARDTWVAGDLTFRIVSPVLTVPDAQAQDPDHPALRHATCPAVLVEIEVDNTACDRGRRFFFGFSGNDPYSDLRQIDPADNGGVRGLVQGRLKGIFCNDPTVQGGRAFSIDAIVRPYRGDDNGTFGLGPVGVMFADAPAGKRTTYRFVVAFYNQGVVTTGQDAVYFYTRYFDGIEAVGYYALNHFDQYLEQADTADAILSKATHLNEAQRWQLAHAVHSYYGSTQFLDLGNAPPLTHDGRTPCWVVNEGEYRMMNTFDLTVDMLFFELRMNPWTMRNVLDRFVDRYSYTDTLHFPDGEDFTPPAKLWEILDRFAEFGLPLHVTEFDVNTEDELTQAEYTRDFYLALFAHPSVDSITTWGFWGGKMWIPQAQMWREDWSMKPNAEAFVKLVTDTLHTHETSTTDTEGQATVRGLHGDYTVTVTGDGNTTQADTTLDPDGQTLTVTLD